MRDNIVGKADTVISSCVARGLDVRVSHPTQVRILLPRAPSRRRPSAHPQDCTVIGPFYDEQTYEPARFRFPAIVFNLYP